MKRYVERPALSHRTQHSPRDRRAVAWHGVSFQAKARAALTITRTNPLVAGLVVALLTSPIPSHPVLAANISPTTERVSLTESGGQANGSITVLPAISADGRFVAFDSNASNLVAGDSNGVRDIFVRDRVAGNTARGSGGPGGSQGNGLSFFPKISADRRFGG